jgi:hypothetical protein
MIMVEKEMSKGQFDCAVLGYFGTQQKNRTLHIGHQDHNHASDYTAGQRVISRTLPDPEPPRGKLSSRER